MDRLTCDLCGKRLLAGEPVRYEARIQVYAAYDPLELTADDLIRDHRAEIRALLAQLRQADPQEIEDGVHKEFRFDLCMACQRRYLRDPLPRHGGRPRERGRPRSTPSGCDRAPHTRQDP